MAFSLVMLRSTFKAGALSPILQSCAHDKKRNHKQAAQPITQTGGGVFRVSFFGFAVAADEKPLMEYGRRSTRAVPNLKPNRDSADRNQSCIHRRLTRPSRHMHWRPGKSPLCIARRTCGQRENHRPVHWDIQALPRWLPMHRLAEGIRNPLRIFDD